MSEVDCAAIERAIWMAFVFDFVKLLMLAAIGFFGLRMVAAVAKGAPDAAD